MEFKGIMNVFFYHGALGERVTIMYWNSNQRKIIEGENKADVFKKMPKTARAFCLKSKNKHVLTSSRDYAISYWYNH